MPRHITNVYASNVVLSEMAVGTRVSGRYSLVLDIHPAVPKPLLKSNHTSTRCRRHTYTKDVFVPL